MRAWIELSYGDHDPGWWRWSSPMSGIASLRADRLGDGHPTGPALSIGGGPTRYAIRAEDRQQCFSWVASQGSCPGVSYGQERIAP